MKSESAMSCFTKPEPIPIRIISGLVCLYLVSDRSKAEMDLKELSETVQQQQQGTQASLTSPKRQIRSRFQLNLDKTIESCKAQLGIRRYLFYQHDVEERKKPHVRKLPTCYRCSKQV